MLVTTAIASGTGTPEPAIDDGYLISDSFVLAARARGPSLNVFVRRLRAVLDPNGIICGPRTVAHTPHRVAVA